MQRLDAVHAEDENQKEADMLIINTCSIRQLFLYKLFSYFLLQNFNYLIF